MWTGPAIHKGTKKYAPPPYEFRAPGVFPGVPGHVG